MVQKFVDQQLGGDRAEAANDSGFAQSGKHEIVAMNGDTLVEHQRVVTHEELDAVTLEIQLDGLPDFYLQPPLKKKSLKDKMEFFYDWMEQNFPAEHQAEIHELMQVFFIETSVSLKEDMQVFDEGIQLLFSLRVLYKNDFQKFKVVFSVLNGLFKIRGIPACNMLVTMWFALYSRQEKTVDKFIVIADYFARTNLYSKDILKVYIQKYEQLGKDAARIYLKYANVILR